MARKEKFDEIVILNLFALRPLQTARQNIKSFMSANGYVCLYCLLL